jgi:hypothetical protein
MLQLLGHLPFDEDALRRHCDQLLDLCVSADDQAEGIVLA